jgi:hypothetical protein
MEYELKAKTVQYAPLSAQWFQNGYSSTELDGVTLGAKVHYYVTLKPSNLLRSEYHQIRLRFSTKTGFMDANGNGAYDIPELYAFDTTNVERSQRAFFYTRGILPTPGKYSGFKWVPFTAFDGVTGKQLNVVIYDYDRNNQWDVDSLGGNMKNWIFIMSSEYDVTGAMYDSTQGGTNLLPFLKGLVPAPFMWLISLGERYMSEPYSSDGELTVTPTYPISSATGYTFNPTVLTHIQPVEKHPIGFALEQNYPNPFNPVTTIRYSLPSRARVTLKVYNLLGQEVAVLENGIKNSGLHSVLFDGRRLASGIYFYRLEAGTMTTTRKFVLLK